VTQRSEPGRLGDPRPYRPVTDDDLVDALQGLQPWRAAGDSLDWDLALIAYDVPANTTVMGVPVPAGLYTREVTGDGRHVIAHLWTDRAALADRLDDVEKRHRLFVHIAHAAPRFVAAHTQQIRAGADRALALIERDERDGGPLYDAPIRCWHDLSRYVDDRRYIGELAQNAGVVASVDDEFVTAVQDHTDALLHHRDRLLSFDEAEAVGFDGTLRDGSEPLTWASLTARQRVAVGLDPSTAGSAAAARHRPEGSGRAGA
jgi:hypothetical protein